MTKCSGSGTDRCDGLREQGYVSWPVGCEARHFDLIDDGHGSRCGSEGKIRLSLSDGGDGDRHGGRGVVGGDDEFGRVGC